MSDELETREDPATARGTAFKDCIDAIDGAMAFGCQGVRKPPAGHWLGPYWLIGNRLATEEHVVRRSTVLLAELALMFDPEFKVEGPEAFDRLIKIGRERTMELELYRAQAAGNGA